LWNPPDGSRGKIQFQPTQGDRGQASGIPPTAVGGRFNSSLPSGVTTPSNPMGWHVSIAGAIVGNGAPVTDPKPQGMGVIENYLRQCRIASVSKARPRTGR